MIEFDHVTKQYPDGTVAVDDLSLRVEKGSLTVFVGPSGCGKTTSMRMVNRMLEPTMGQIRLDGVDVAQGSAVELRRGIGYVIQSAGLLPHRTVVDNVATVLLLQGVHRKEARSRALDVMERVGLPLELARRFPASLSGGQEQRVGVARALAADPQVMLMDEPFSAVDPLVREELQRELRRLQAELHKTIIFVTHDMDEAMLLGDRVAVFGGHGTLQQYAPPEEILARPATEFVESLVGRDRGYRALSFLDSADLSIRPAPVVSMADSATADLPDSGWLLVTTQSGHPMGWLDAAHQRSLHGAEPDAEALAPLGSQLVAGGSLRQALDAALSSPSGQGVVVNSEGVAIGVIGVDEVAARLAQVRAAEAAVGANR